uniref:Mut7-C RNAse domain-containing protein n=1 Tax=uncultured marine group II/III euryarchaeote KM3_185_B03 TaxID=1457948 RepID=A0A075GNY2_9EURY|nr:hypothetical protein [uncultured marine group II/III euryarchaeote KM3_185_B03]
MLGRLARWLRLLGHDTLYADVGDDELLRLAETRRLLTRDRELARRGNVAPIESDELRAQLFEIAPPPTTPFTRCTACNGALHDASSAEAARAPERVRAVHGEFRACDACGQLYWPGTHFERIRDSLREWGLLE